VGIDVLVEEVFSDLLLLILPWFVGAGDDDLVEEDLPDDLLLLLLLPLRFVGDFVGEDDVGANVLGSPSVGTNVFGAPPPAGACVGSDVGIDVGTDYRT